MLQLRTILHPTDLSPRSEPAFQLACALASQYAARLIVLHVIEPIMAYGEVGIVIEPPGGRESLWQELRAHRGFGGIQVEHRLEEGAPAGVIARVADELGCDLIVMGTHGRQGLSRLLMGSVAERVVRLAPCPVLTVKSPVGVPTKVPTPAHQFARA